MNRQFGFTLLELIIVMAIAAILLTVGVPSFRETQLNNRMTTQVNDFVTSLHFTRSEAVKRGRRVTMCKSDDGQQCKTGGDADWQDGWLVYVDNNGNSSFDVGVDALLRPFEELQGGNVIVANNPVANRITYTSLGRSTAGSLTFCDERGDNSARVVTISPAGRPTIYKLGEQLPDTNPRTC